MVGLEKDVEVNGRNDELFHSLRVYGYSAYRRLNWDPIALQTDLEDKALELTLSQNPSNPLSQREAFQVAKSATRWTSTHHSKAGFSAIQSKRANIRHAKTATERAERDELILFMTEELDFTMVELAENLGLSVGGAKNRLFQARNRRKVAAE